VEQYHAADMDDDELEFVKAVAVWREAHPGCFPALRELLDVLKGLGWAKTSR
jgi:hypothetical protein